MRCSLAYHIHKGHLARFYQTEHSSLLIASCDDVLHMHADGNYSRLLAPEVSTVF
jgi:hypothetical protein